ncbi:MAG TPA: hypothetical protein VGQ90_00610 [Stellaceae bacterium]|jgi:hypothetical protein|nr:hypothetical protein [Stellaceae bacterium]
MLNRTRAHAFSGLAGIGRRTTASLASLAEFLIGSSPRRTLPSRISRDIEEPQE